MLAARGFPQGGAIYDGPHTMLAQAFATTIPKGGWIVAVCAFLFGYTTLIGWAYYGEQFLEYIFGRRVTKRTPGRFRTRVLTEGVTPTLHVDYKKARIKQYHKEGRALRTETVGRVDVWLYAWRHANPKEGDKPWTSASGKRGRGGLGATRQRRSARSRPSRRGRRGG